VGSGFDHKVTSSIIIIFKIEVFPGQPLGIPMFRPWKSPKSEENDARYRKAGYGRVSRLLLDVCMCGFDSKSETRSSRRKKSSADLGFHYPGDLLSQARPRRRPLYKRNTVSDFANGKCRQTSSAMLGPSIESGKLTSSVHVASTA